MTGHHFHQDGAATKEVVKQSQVAAAGALERNLFFLVSGGTGLTWSCPRPFSTLPLVASSSATALDMLILGKCRQHP
jgi:hypothetical protein